MTRLLLWFLFFLASPLLGPLGLLLAGALFPFALAGTAPNVR